MAFVTDKEELKPGLVIFRRGDLQSRDWYCRVRLPKATRYKTIALKTPDITTARTLAYDHESEIRFALKRNLPVFNRPFAAVAKDYIGAPNVEAIVTRLAVVERLIWPEDHPEAHAMIARSRLDLIALSQGNPTNLLDA